MPVKKMAFPYEICGRKGFLSFSPKIIAHVLGPRVPTNLYSGLLPSGVLEIFMLFLFPHNTQKFDGGNKPHVIILNFFCHKLNWMKHQKEINCVKPAPPIVYIQGTKSIERTAATIQVGNFVASFTFNPQAICKY